VPRKRLPPRSSRTKQAHTRTDAANLAAVGEPFGQGPTNPSWDTAPKTKARDGCCRPPTPIVAPSAGRTNQSTTSVCTHSTRAEKGATRQLISLSRPEPLTQFNCSHTHAGQLDGTGTERFGLEQTFHPLKFRGPGKSGRKIAPTLGARFSLPKSPLQGPIIPRQPSVQLLGHLGLRFPRTPAVYQLGEIFRQVRE
jgi:hypothetical protein